MQFSEHESRSRVLNELDGILDEPRHIRQLLLVINLDCFTDGFLKAALSRKDVRAHIWGGSRYPVNFAQREHRVRIAKLLHSIDIYFHFDSGGRLVFKEEYNGNKET